MEGDQRDFESTSSDDEAPDPPLLELNTARRQRAAAAGNAQQDRAPVRGLGLAASGRSLLVAALDHGEQREPQAAPPSAALGVGGGTASSGTVRVPPLVAPPRPRPAVRSDPRPFLIGAAPERPWLRQPPRVAAAAPTIGPRVGSGGSGGAAVAAASHERPPPRRPTSHGPNPTRFLVWDGPDKCTSITGVHRPGPGSCTVCGCRYHEEVSYTAQYESRFRGRRRRR